MPGRRGDGRPRRCAAGPARLARFELAPPRRFLLPAILLLLSEEPGYGYRLVKELKEFRFGRVDRPSVYRALAQLEADGLVGPWTEAAQGGQRAARVRADRATARRSCAPGWASINEERACLDRVLRRYHATGTGDAVLAGVEGHWTVLGRAWSPVSSTSPAAEPPRGDDDAPLVAREADVPARDAPTPYAGTWSASGSA